MRRHPIASVAAVVAGLLVLGGLIGGPLEFLSGLVAGFVVLGVMIAELVSLALPLLAILAVVALAAAVVLAVRSTRHRAALRPEVVA